MRRWDTESAWLGQQELGNSRQEGMRGGAWGSEAMLERKKASSGIVREVLTMCLFLIAVRQSIPNSTQQISKPGFGAQLIENWVQLYNSPEPADLFWVQVLCTQHWNIAF